jgi:hypothetical protein
MKHKKIWIPGVLFIGLIVFRLYLPEIVKNYVNRTLDKIPGYKGHVDDIDLSLWRGAYQIIGLDLKKISGDVPVPFFSVKTADLSVQWRELFHGSLVGTIALDQPKLNFVAGPNEEKSQTSIDDSWQDRVAELFPLRINNFTIHDGDVHFRNFHADPQVDVNIGEIQLSAENLTNSRNKPDVLMSHMHATARPMNEAYLEANLDFNPLVKQPTFRLDGKLEQLNLTSINNFLLHYAGLKSKTGRVALYTEFESKNGDFYGYVKPFFEDVVVINTITPDLTLGQKIKSVFAQLAADILRNKRKDTVATKIEFTGSLEDPNVNVWRAVRYVFHHGFIRALKPRIDNALHQ